MYEPTKDFACTNTNPRTHEHRHTYTHTSGRKRGRVEPPSQIGIYDSREILLPAKRAPRAVRVPSIRYNFSANRIRDFVAESCVASKRHFAFHDLFVQPKSIGYTILLSSPVYRSRFLFSRPTQTPAFDSATRIPAACTAVRTCSFLTLPPRLPLARDFRRDADKPELSTALDKTAHVYFFLHFFFLFLSRIHRDSATTELIRGTCNALKRRLSRRSVDAVSVYRANRHRSTCDCRMRVYVFVCVWVCLWQERDNKWRW